MKISIELLPRAEAIMMPAGKARNAPNQHPFLPDPVRPNLFQGLGINLNFLNPFFLLKKYRFCVICCCSAVCGVIVLLVIVQAKG